ncbi:MAG: shikimate kinase [Thiotrichales bacterium]|nr:shikimate kinase [Thiotrichales bacterium]
MGVGKTTIGKRLAKVLDLKFYDSDSEVVQRTGVDVPVIFDIEGEEGFRKRETEILRELTALAGVVLATGGGAVISGENRELLKNNGFVIYLVADIDLILKRISKDTRRPLLQNDDPRGTLVKLMQERDPLYSEIADLKIDTTNFNIKQIIDRIYNHQVPYENTDS